MQESERLFEWYHLLANQKNRFRQIFRKVNIPETQQKVVYGKKI